MTPRGGKPTLAVVGATGAVGAALLRVLSERRDVWGEIKVFASASSRGQVVHVRGEDLTVASLDEDVGAGVDVAILCIPEALAVQVAPMLAGRGVVVIDHSAAFRADPAVPVVAPSINPEATAHRTKGIIASPNCLTLAIVEAVAVLHTEWELSELVVASYQAASGAGRAGLRRLHEEVELLVGDTHAGAVSGGIRRKVDGELGGASPFPAPLAFNVVPWVGSLREDGWSSEEMKVREESRKILQAPWLKVSATCVRVPVGVGHSVALHATFRRPITVDEAREALVRAPSVVVIDDPDHGEWPTPADIAGSDPTFVGRIRQSLDVTESLELFACSDNLRNGGATNAAHVAELVCGQITGSP